MAGLQTHTCLTLSILVGAPFLDNFTKLQQIFCIGMYLVRISQVFLVKMKLKIDEQNIIHSQGLFSNAGSELNFREKTISIVDHKL